VLNSEHSSQSSAGFLVVCGHDVVVALGRRCAFNRTLSSVQPHGEGPLHRISAYHLPHYLMLLRQRPLTLSVSPSPVRLSRAKPRMVPPVMPSITRRQDIVAPLPKTLPA